MSVIKATFSSASAYIKDLLSRNDAFESFLLVVGLMWFFGFAFRLFAAIHRILRRKLPLNIGDRYGKGSWAVVTGGSDGIGRAFCEELAQQGLNIVLIARNKDKLEKVAQEIKQKAKIETKIIVADFTRSSSPGFF